MQKLTERLTICIPTYNREQELRYALSSINSTLGDSVNVVVSDNASDDGTMSLCKHVEEEKIFRTFCYVRSDTNRGADWNYLNAVKHAETEYCMILGSDDALVDQAQTLLSHAISSDSDITIFPRICFDRNMLRCLGIQTFWKKNHRSMYNLSDPDEFKQYISSSTSLAAVFSYLSCFVFKRELWRDNARVREFVGSAYSHVAALLDGITTRSRTILNIQDDPIVKCRMGNDSFLTNDVSKRFEIDWDGYEHLSRVFFPNDTGALTDILKRCHRFYDLLALRYWLEKNGQMNEMERLKNRLRNAEWGLPSLAKFVIASYIPLCFIEIVKKK